MKSFNLWLLAALAATAPFGAALAAPACGHACLEKIGNEYRVAYLKHDPSLAPIAAKVRFSENNVMMKFPDASWDTITEEIGPAEVFSDPQTGGVGIYTTIMERRIPAFVGIRLKVVNGKITEIEQTVSTKRNLSSPPTPIISDMHNLQVDPLFAAILAPEDRSPRAEIIKQADGYFSTLQQNDGTLKANFGPHCHRLENGMETAPKGCDKAFLLGFYAFNNRVRDREYMLVDEQRGLVMSRAFIDHKGVLDKYKLTNGTEITSVFQEPQTWCLLETFKVIKGQLGPIMTAFIEVPYYSPSPWTPHPYE